MSVKSEAKQANCFRQSMLVQKAAFLPFMQTAVPIWSADLKPLCWFT